MSEPKPTGKADSGKKPPLRGLPSTEIESRSQALRTELVARLNELQESIQAAPTQREKLQNIASLVDVAVRATKTLEALHSSPIYGPLVREISLCGDTFAASYDLSLPSPLRTSPLAYECRGDTMRRELTDAWQAQATLKTKPKSEIDWLRLLMNGFVKAVYQPAPGPAPSKIKGSSFLDLFLESKGNLEVPEEDRAELLSTKSNRDAGTWARAFVKWYEAHHPLPFECETEYPSWPEEESKVKDPLHRIGFQRLASLQKSNPNEKSPWNALRAVVRERFEAALNKP